MAANSMTPPDGSPVHVLVVSDDSLPTDESSLATMLCIAFRYEGWAASTAQHGATALRAARKFRPDAIVLDVAPPSSGGHQILADLHAEVPDVPILLLSAADATADRIAGLYAGADDYVTKPFSLEEVLARLRVVMRRAGRIGQARTDELTVADLRLVENTREVTRAGIPIALTATEYKLLRYLMHNQRRVVSKSQILDHVWNYDFGGRANIVQLYISYLRRKIDHREPHLIHTVRGFGYTLRKPDGDSPVQTF